MGLSFDWGAAREDRDSLLRFCFCLICMRRMHAELGQTHHLHSEVFLIASPDRWRLVLMRYG